MISGIVMAAFALFLLALIVRSINGGTITGSSSVNLQAQEPPQGNASPNTLAPIKTTLPFSASQTMAFGTAAGQVNLLVGQQRTLALSSNETLNLNSGAILDVFGVASPFLHLKYICIYIVSGGDVNGLTIEGGASNPFLGPLGGTTPSLTIYPSGPGYQNGEPSVGWPCGSTACNIKIINNSSVAAVTYAIVLAGTTT
jgi:hypothetical protein